MGLSLKAQRKSYWGAAFRNLSSEANHFLPQWFPEIPQIRNAHGIPRLELFVLQHQPAMNPSLQTTDSKSNLCMSLKRSPAQAIKGRPPNSQLSSGVESRKAHSNNRNDSKGKGKASFVRDNRQQSLRFQASIKGPPSTAWRWLKSSLAAAKDMALRTLRAERCLLQPRSESELSVKLCRKSNNWGNEGAPAQMFERAQNEHHTRHPDKCFFSVVGARSRNKGNSCSSESSACKVSLVCLTTFEAATHCQASVVRAESSKARAEFAEPGVAAGNAAQATRKRGICPLVTGDLERCRASSK